MPIQSSSFLLQLLGWDLQNIITSGRAFAMQNALPSVIKFIWMIVCPILWRIWTLIWSQLISLLVCWFAMHVVIFGFKWWCLWNRKSNKNILDLLTWQSRDIWQCFITDHHVTPFYMELWFLPVSEFNWLVHDHFAVGTMFSGSHSMYRGQQDMGFSSYGNSIHHDQ